MTQLTTQTALAAAQVLVAKAEALEPPPLGSLQLGAAGQGGRQRTSVVSPIQLVVYLWAQIRPQGRQSRGL